MADPFIPRELAAGVLLSVALHAAWMLRARSVEAREQRRQGPPPMEMFDVEPNAPVPPEPEPERQPDPAADAPAPPTAPRAIDRSAPRAGDPPPAAAEAGKVLTAADDAPLDLTGFSMVQGEAARYAGGVTSSKGTSSTAVRDGRARDHGVPGGTGSAPSRAAPVAEGPDLSQPARPSARDWSCSHLFPAEADADNVHQARVMVVVTVRPDGSAASVHVVDDPGRGFGRAARTCALSQRYVAALDRSGRPTTGTTPQFAVRFTR